VAVWLEPRRLAAAGAVVALLIAAFVAGRITKRGNPGDDIANKEQVRERVLVVAVGEHLATPKGCWWSFQTRRRTIRRRRK